MNRTIAFTLLTSILAAGTPVLAQQERSPDTDPFVWEGVIAAGSWLGIRNVNGSIDVQQATGNVAIVKADKRWRRGDPRDVKIEVYKDGANVTVCALWENDSCDEDGYQSHGRKKRNNDVSVRFTVQIPKGVKVLAHTVNGTVEIAGASSEVDASSVNGRVEVSSLGGPVAASTVNGDVIARMGSIGNSKDGLRFATVNGSVTVEMPEPLNIDVELETVNGRVSSDFPMTITGKINPRHLRAKIGDGGVRVEMTTVNGSVELRKPR